MSDNNYTAPEVALIKKMDAIIELKQTNDFTKNGIAAFVDKFDLLCEKRIQVSAQSVVKHQANKQKSATVNDATADKVALATFVSDSLGHFKEYVKEQNDTNFKSDLAKLTLSNLKKLKPFDLVTNLNSFAETVKTLKADRLIYHGLEADWVATLTNKVTDYSVMLPKKETSKSNKPVETSNFKTIIKEIKDIIESLNNLIVGYKTKNPEFYDNYMRVAGLKNPATQTPKKRAKSKTPKVKSLLPKEKKVRKSRKKAVKPEPEVVENAPSMDTTDAVQVS